MPNLQAVMLNDNIQSLAVQGMLRPYTSVKLSHTTVPTTVNGGPHGMHTTGGTWVKAHKSQFNWHRKDASCKCCNGTTTAGKPLSAIKVVK